MVTTFLILIRERVRLQMETWAGQRARTRAGGGADYTYAASQFRYYEAAEKYFGDLIPNAHHLSHETGEVIQCLAVAENMLLTQSLLNRIGKENEHAEPIQ